MDFPGKSLSISAKQRLLGGRDYSLGARTTTSGRPEEELETRKKWERERDRERYLPTFFRDCTYFLCTGGRSSASREWRRNGSRIFWNRETEVSLIQASLDSISPVGIRTLSLPVLRFLFFFFLREKLRCFRISLLVKRRCWRCLNEELVRRARDGTIDRINTRIIRKEIWICACNIYHFEYCLRIILINNI